MEMIWNECYTDLRVAFDFSYEFRNRHLPISQSVYFSVRLSVRLSVILSVCRLVFPCKYVSQSECRTFICLSVHLSVCHFVFTFVCPFIWHKVRLSICLTLSVYLLVCLYVYTFVDLYVCQSVCSLMFLFVCALVFLSDQTYYLPEILMP